MANITFDDKELRRVKYKQGIYSNLNKFPLTIESVEVAFKKYAKAHGCKVGFLEIEWKRFQKILLNELRTE